EDGIRGGHVTGVQTCALPILANRRGSTTQGRGGTDSFTWVERCDWAPSQISESGMCRPALSVDCGHRRAPTPTTVSFSSTEYERSEERRGGQGRGAELRGARG